MPIVQRTIGGHALLSDRIHEMIAAGSAQYIAPYPDFDTYAARTERGENWSLWKGTELVAVVSMLPNGLPDDWPGVDPGKHLWIASLFVHKAHKHAGYGKTVLALCKEQAAEAKFKLFLDCYLDSGFLETYYQSQGFTTIATTSFHFPGRTFEAALMSF